MIPSRKSRAPAHLSPKSRSLWRATLAEWALEPHNAALFRLALESLDRSDEAKAIVDREGLLVIGSVGQPRPHPLLAVERDARAQCARLLGQLGLDDADSPDTRRVVARGDALSPSRLLT